MNSQSARLDEETERLIDEAIYHEQTLQGTLGRNARTAKSWIKAREAARDNTLNALRLRIAQLVDEAEQNGIRSMARTVNEPRKIQ
jgi:hypothetical protein